MKIRDIELRHGLFLAPMAGVTDYAFRVMCKRRGAEMMVSEMISAKGMHYRDEKTAALAAITPEEQPMALQIFGSEPEIMAEASARLEERFHPAAIDINMGCPVRKVVSNGEGSALMRNLLLAQRIISAVVDAVRVPVTVKIRAGWDDDSLNAPEAARCAESAGAAAVCVHGRTREQLYAPPVNLRVIAAVKEAVSIPVIGNGGINSAADALEMLRQTGCDGLMVARGAEGNPWIFSEIIAALEGREFRAPSLRERVESAMEHTRLLVADKGGHVGVCEARRQAAYYIRGFRDAAGIRGRLNQCVSEEEILMVLGQLLEGEVS